MNVQQFQVYKHQPEHKHTRQNRINNEWFYQRGKHRSRIYCSNHKGKSLATLSPPLPFLYEIRPLFSAPSSSSPSCLLPSFGLLFLLVAAFPSPFPLPPSTFHLPPSPAHLLVVGLPVPPRPPLLLVLRLADRLRCHLRPQLIAVRRLNTVAQLGPVPERLLNKIQVQCKSVSSQCETFHLSFPAYFATLNIMILSRT